MNSDHNPHRPAASNLDVATPPRSLEPVGRGRRFGTFVVDYIAFMLLSAVVGIVVGVVLGPKGIESLAKVPDIVFGVLIFFAYYFFFEGIWARTPGKWVFGTVVVDEAGFKPTLGQVVGRTVCRLIPFEPLSFFGATGWHDRFPKTRVVRHSVEA